MLHAPPGTAIHNERNQGWSVTDHLAALQLDLLNLLFWAKTVDGQKNRNRPPPTPRPGLPDAAEPEDENSPFTVTIEEYIRLAAEAEVTDG